MNLRERMRKDRAKKCVHMNLSNGGTCTHLAEGLENRMCYILEPRAVAYNLHEDPEWIDYCPFRGAAHFCERGEGGEK